MVRARRWRGIVKQAWRARRRRCVGGVLACGALSSAALLQHALRHKPRMPFALTLSATRMARPPPLYAARALLQRGAYRSFGWFGTDVAWDAHFLLASLPLLFARASFSSGRAHWRTLGRHIFNILRIVVLCWCNSLSSDGTPFPVSVSLCRRLGSFMYHA